MKRRFYDQFVTERPTIGDRSPSAFRLDNFPEVARSSGRAPGSVSRLRSLVECGRCCSFEHFDSRFVIFNFCALVIWWIRIGTMFAAVSICLAVWFTLGAGEEQAVSVNRAVGGGDDKWMRFSTGEFRIFKNVCMC